MSFAAWINLVAGLLIVGLSVPLWLRKVPMNRWYGVRVPKSFVSLDNWYRINRFGGQMGVAVGALITLVGVVCLAWPPHSEALAILLLMAPAFLAIPLLVAVFWYAGRI